MVRSIKQVEQAAIEQSLPIEMHFTEPSIKDSFWVQVLGKGNCPPTPASKYRWCTEKLKIRPVDRVVWEIIENTPTTEVLTDDAFDVLMLLGVREEESANRRRSIQKFATEDKFARHANYENIKVYHPIKHVTQDDLWAYLLNKGTLPWNGDAYELFNIYAEFSKECPMTDQDGKQHESCGGGRQGCVVCIVAGKKDQMLISLIENGDTSLIPMLEFKAQMYDMRLDVRYREPLRRVNEMRLVPTKSDREQASIFMDSEYDLFDRADNWRYEPGPITLEGRRILLQKLLYVEKVSGEKYIRPEEMLAILKAWKEDGYEPTEADMQPVNHQPDGAILFKQDGTLNQKTSTIIHPLFYVPLIFHEGAGELVGKLKKLALSSGRHYFYAMRCIDPHRDFELNKELAVVNVVEFVICQQGVTSQSEAERSIREWLEKGELTTLIQKETYFAMLYGNAEAAGSPTEALDELVKGFVGETQGNAKETA